MLRTRRERASMARGFDDIVCFSRAAPSGSSGAGNRRQCGAWSRWAAATGNPFADHGNARSKSLEDDRRIALEGYERFRSIMSLRRQASHMSHPFFFNAPAPQAEAPPKSVRGSALRKLWPYIWPSGRLDLTLRIFASMALLLAAKVITIAVPYSFKWATDAMRDPA